jgi:hypothetical protein
MASLLYEEGGFFYEYSITPDCIGGFHTQPLRGYLSE